MNNEQVKSVIQNLVATFGGMIAGFFAAKGWLSAEQIMAILNSGTFVGLVTSVVVFVWGWINRSKTNQVAAVNALPEVAGVVTTPTSAGVALATAIPSPTVAPAGTVQAATIAGS